MSLTTTISSWPRSKVVVEDVLRSLPQAGEHLRVRAGDPGRRLAQAVPVGVLTDREEDLPDGALDPRRVVRRAGDAGPDTSSGRVTGSIRPGHPARGRRRGQCTPEAPAADAVCACPLPVPGGPLGGRRAPAGCRRRARRSLDSQTGRSGRFTTAAKISASSSLLRVSFSKSASTRSSSTSPVLDEDLPGLVVGVLDEAADLLVDDARDLLGVVALVARSRGRGRPRPGSGRA